MKGKDNAGSKVIEKTDSNKTKKLNIKKNKNLIISFESQKVKLNRDLKIKLSTPNVVVINNQDFIKLDISNRGTNSNKIVNKGFKSTPSPNKKTPSTMTCTRGIAHECSCSFLKVKESKLVDFTLGIPEEVNLNDTIEFITEEIPFQSEVYKKFYKNSFICKEKDSYKTLNSTKLPPNCKIHKKSNSLKKIRTILSENEKISLENENKNDLFDSKRKFAKSLSKKRKRAK